MAQLAMAHPIPTRVTSRRPDRVHRLAEDLAPAVGDAAGSFLAAALEWMTGFERTELVADWSTSSSDSLRLLVARVLAHASSVVGSLSAIEHLAADPDPRVRAAVARAARARSGEAPGRLQAVLARLIQDRDPEVRAVAAAAAV